LFEKLGATPLLIIFAVIFIIIQLAFRVFTPPFMEATGGIGIPDRSIAYAPGHIYMVLSAITGEALNWYNRIQIVDSFYPLVYAALFSGLLFRIYRRKYENFSSYGWIVTIPLVGALCDYLENIGFRIILNQLPARFDLLGWILSVFSTIKFLAAGFSLLMILTGIIYFINGRRNSRFAKD